MALTAVLAAYMLASSWNLPMFFLYRILLLPNQFDTCGDGDERSGYSESRRAFAVEAPRKIKTLWGNVKNMSLVLFYMEITLQHHKNSQIISEI